MKKKAKKRKPRRLRAVVEKHLGISLDDAQCVTHDVKSVEHVNLQRVIDRWAACPDAPGQVFGFSCTGYFSSDSLMQYLITDKLIQAPVERAQLDSGPDESLDCVTRGLFLVRHAGGPVALFLRPGRLSGPRPVLELLAGTRDAARAALTALLDESQARSVYKGHTITLEAGDSRRDGIAIRFHKMRPTRREDLILPAELLAVIERSVTGMLRHGETLRAAGRSLRQGLLLHGAPGTGKTMMVRYLAQACVEHTVILLTGADLGLVREACQIARLLAPSIVVLEDVDLIAEDRQHNRCPSLLHGLMNEMDGLGPRAEVIFLLSTNRPEILEPALSARPGRIDQAVEFPLPDDECRGRLFALYGKGLDLAAVDVARWVTQTDGVSPAFIEELLRKSALLAAERGETGRPLRLIDEDVQNAAKELVVFGGELTQKMLGYRSGKFGLAALRPE